MQQTQIKIQFVSAAFYTANPYVYTTRSICSLEVQELRIKPVCRTCHITFLIQQKGKAAETCFVVSAAFLLPSKVLISQAENHVLLLYDQLILLCVADTCAAYRASAFSAVVAGEQGQIPQAVSGVCHAFHLQRPYRFTL